MLLEQRALFIGVDCLSFQYNLEKLERAPQKFSRASRAPFPVFDASIIQVETTPSSPKSCIHPCNEIGNSDRKATCVFVCACVRGGGGGGGGGGSLCICPPSDRQATSPLFVLVLLVTAAYTLILWQVFMLPEEANELHFCAKYESQDVGPQIHAETSNQYGVCGYSEAPNTPPQYWSLNKLVVLRSAFWDARQFKNLQQGYWVLLIEAEKRIVEEKLLVGVQIGNHISSDIQVHVLNMNRRYIDHVTLVFAVTLQRSIST